MLKVALTHDVDRTKKTYQHITHGLRSLMKLDVGSARYHLLFWSNDNTYWNFQDIIEIENHYNVKSTFFFLIESIAFHLLKPSTWKLSLGRYDINEPRMTEIIRYLDQSGWETGVHGSYNSYRNIDLLKSEKRILESVVNHKISGVRQHYLNLDTHTWKLQQEAGFHYDTTWGFTRAIGFKEGRIAPFQPLGNDFTVFPLHIMDFCYLSTPKRLDQLRRMINTTIEHDGILVINWHSNVFNEREFPGYKNGYIEIIEECIRSDAHFDTLGNIYNQYYRIHKCINN